MMIHTRALFAREQRGAMVQVNHPASPPARQEARNARKKKETSNGGNRFGSTSWGAKEAANACSMVGADHH